jgi:ubiquinone/menaquinone biosynthesis C-methylase UbiE
MAPPYQGIDHFAQQAAAYHVFRPVYPPALAAFFASRAPRRKLAWDCGCGSGQLTVSLSFMFERVVATDLSLPQLRQAQRSVKIDYIEALAEAVPLADHTADLVVTAQSLHWFDLARFYPEVRRVIRPGGIIAAVSYGLVEISASIDRIVQRLHSEIVGPFWAAERRHVDNRYSELPFPFTPIEPPTLAMKAEWSLNHLLGYLGTWSAVQSYRSVHGIDPMEQVRPELESAWGSSGLRRTVRWPLTILVGKVE